MVSCDAVCGEVPTTGEVTTTCSGIANGKVGPKPPDIEHVEGVEGSGADHDGAMVPEPEDVYVVVVDSALSASFAALWCCGGTSGLGAVISGNG